jgi:hypothetical protein
MYLLCNIPDGQTYGNEFPVTNFNSSKFRVTPLINNTTSMNLDILVHYVVLSPQLEC